MRVDQKDFSLPEAIRKEIEILHRKILEEKKTWVLLMIVNLVFNILMYNNKSSYLIVSIILVFSLFNIGITYLININLNKVRLLINIGVKEKFKEAEIKNKSIALTKFNNISCLMLIINTFYIFIIL